MEFVMVILKPYEIDGLSQLEKNFDFHFLGSIKKEETIELKLPKFKFEVTLNLNDALRQVIINFKCSINKNINFLLVKDKI